MQCGNMLRKQAAAWPHPFQIYSAQSSSRLATLPKQCMPTIPKAQASHPLLFPLLSVSLISCTVSNCQPATCEHAGIYKGPKPVSSHLKRHIACSFSNTAVCDLTAADTTVYVYPRRPMRPESVTNRYPSSGSTRMNKAKHEARSCHATQQPLLKKLRAASRS